MSPPQRNNNKAIDTANEEWPEIQTTLVSRLAPVDPTPQEVNVNNSLSAQDLKSLKKRDPFLYYSIPGVRDATIRLEHADVDMHQIAQNGLKRCCQTSFTSEPVAKVKRCTRVSFECPQTCCWTWTISRARMILVIWERHWKNTPWKTIHVKSSYSSY
mmetsp:Transcript_35496/g.52162  ORF Transcript_35496/g.52162 Transcript_35496/m.52162 type:complete len:158 (+) Transcript_35496:137-610(+)